MILNEALPATAIYETNQKQLNSLSIQYARGIRLSENDLDILRAIAGQCPEDAGRTRERAIGMLPWAEASAYQRENPDEFSCAENAEREASGYITRPRNFSWTAAPNPVSGRLQLAFERPFQGSISLINQLGIVVRRQISREGIISTVIDIETLPPGMYWIHVADELNSSTDKKLVVISR